MTGTFYEVFENGREEVTLSSQKKTTFCASYLEVRMFNVGSGEAILLTLPGRKSAWVIDCGCHHNEALGEALAGYLNDEGIKLKGIVLSHPHFDHGGAIETLVQKAPLASTVTYCRSRDEYFWPPKPWIKTLNTELNAMNAALKKIVVEQNGMERVDLGKGVQARMYSGKRVSGGYTSIFMHIRYKAARLLFTGDVSCGYEEKLLKESLGYEFRADVLKVTHHGSSSGTSNKLLCAVDPGIAIASTGHDAGHRLERGPLKRLGGRPGDREVLETRVDGDIILQTDGSSSKGRVLYYVDKEDPGRFAAAAEAKTVALDSINRASGGPVGCGKDC